MSQASSKSLKASSDPDGGRTSAPVVLLMNDALTTALREFRRLVKRCRSQGDAESIHRLRIQSRRMVVWCDLLHSLDAGSGTQEARRCIKKLLRALARVRDAQVQQELLKKVPRRWTAATSTRWILSITALSRLALQVRMARGVLKAMGPGVWQARSAVRLRRL